MKYLDKLTQPGLNIAFLWLKALIVVLAIVFYWVYDSAFLAAYGIGPEMNVRGVFESKLVSTWLGVHALEPLVCLLLLILLICIVLAAVHECLQKQKQGSASWAMLIRRSVGRPRPTNPYERAIWAVFLALLFLLCVAVGIAFLSGNAREQVQRQVDRFLEEGECTDLFSSASIGCYSVSGEAGDEHLLIFKGDNALVYMTKPQPGALGSAAAAQVVVVYKGGRKIVRSYKRPNSIKPIGSSE